jgi:hypothetical protein
MGRDLGSGKIAGGRVELVFLEFWEQGGGRGPKGGYFPASRRGRRGRTGRIFFFISAAFLPKITKTSFNGALNKIILWTR